jgi:hypothetical protein
VANPGRSCTSSDHLDGHRKLKRHEQCGALWQAAKAAGTTGGATWPQFLESCRAQLASTTRAPPQGGFMPASTPAPAPSPAPAAIGFTVSMAAASSSTGWKRRVERRRIASPQQAQYHCPGSTVVWVNEHSHICHFPGTRDYGHTKSGLICARRRLRLPVLAQR